MEEINEYIDEHLKLFKDVSISIYNTTNPTHDKIITTMIDNHIRVLDMMVTTLKELKVLLNQKTII